MQYLHTMVRISNVDESLRFYCDLLGLTEIRRYDSEAGRFTNIFLAAPEDEDRARSDKKGPVIELTYNWDPEEYGTGRAWGHLAFQTDDIYALCQKLQDNGVTINRPPRDGYMAFIKSPDGVSVELLQKGESLPEQEPWASMENIGTW